LITCSYLPCLVYGMSVDWLGGDCFLFWTGRQLCYSQAVACKRRIHQPVGLPKYLPLTALDTKECNHFQIRFAYVKTLVSHTWFHHARFQMRILLRFWRLTEKNWRTLTKHVILWLVRSLQWVVVNAQRHTPNNLRPTSKTKSPCGTHKTIERTTQSRSSKFILPAVIRRYTSNV
jgi:hypothetical protein